MDTTIRKTKKFQPYLKSRKYRILFMVLNFYLIIGVLSLLISIFYLLVNLDQADKIIIYCVPGFVVFISAFIFYLIGYQSMILEQKNEKHSLKFKQKKNSNRIIRSLYFKEYNSNNQSKRKYKLLMYLYVESFGRFISQNCSKRTITQNLLL